MRRGVISLAFILSGLILNCTSIVKESPNPGVLQVWIATNPDARDSLGIVKGDLFILEVTEIYVYSAYNTDTAFTRIYDNVDAYMDTINYVNAFQFELNIDTIIDTIDTVVDTIIDTLATGNFAASKVGESYLPPRTFNKLILSIYPFEWAVIGGIGGPVSLHGDPVIKINHNFEIYEQDTTKIILQFEASKSIYRWKDEYRFTPIFTIK